MLPRRAPNAAQFFGQVTQGSRLVPGSRHASAGGTLPRLLVDASNQCLYVPSTYGKVAHMEDTHMNYIPSTVHFRLSSPTRTDLPRSVITDKRSRSISPTAGKVIAYRHSTVLHNVTFKVNAKEQQRIAGGKCKSVHAQAWGLVDSSLSETLADHPELTVEVRYNPKRAPWFHRIDDATGAIVPVHSAPMVGFSTAANGQGRCWIAPIR